MNHLFNERLRLFTRKLCCAGFIYLLGIVATQAQTVTTWTGMAGTNWNNAGNWNNGIPSTSAFKAVFNTSVIVEVDGAIAGMSLGQLQVTNNSTVTLRSSAIGKSILVGNGQAGDDISVGAGSTLNITGSAPGTLTTSITLLVSNTGLIDGTLAVANGAGTNAGSFTNNAVAANLIFSATGKYQHGINSGTIPAATWNTTSTCEVTGTTNTSPSGINGQTFGNFIWNCASQSSSALSIATGAFSVAGNLTVQATNSQTINLVSGAFTVGVSGNVNVMGGTARLINAAGAAILNVSQSMNISGTGGFVIGGSSATGSPTLNITQDLNITSTAAIAFATIVGASTGIANVGRDFIHTSTGGVNVVDGITSSAVGIINVTRHFTSTGGALRNTSTSSATGTINFVGTSNQNVNITSAFNNSGSRFVDFVLNNNGAGITLLATTSTLPGRFTITQGNIEVSTFTLNITNLILLKTGSVTTSVLSKGVGGKMIMASTGTFTLTRNVILDNTADVLEMQNTADDVTAMFVATGADIGTTYVKGTFTRRLPASADGTKTWTLPIGSGTYNPFILTGVRTNAAGTVDVKASVFDANAGGTVGTNMIALNTDRYWQASVSGAGTIDSRTFIQVGDLSATSTSRIARSATQTGAYDLLGGALTTKTAPDPNLVKSSRSLAASLGFFVIGSAANLAGGTYSVGESRTYRNLTAVASELNELTLTGNIVFELYSDYDATTENFPISFLQYNTSGGNWTAKVQLNSSVAAPIVTTGSSGAGNNYLINFNGVDRLTFDGRAGGTGSNVLWTIRNTVVSTSGGTMQFNNDASNNTLKALQIEGENSTVSGNAAIISFGTGTTTGSDNNLIDSCIVRERTDLVNAGYANGIINNGTGVSNDNNTISNSQIINYFLGTTTASGIRLSTVSSNWLIKGNHFYQTITRTSTGATIQLAINVGSSVTGCRIIGNYIGGSAINAGGTPFTISGPAASHAFGGIRAQGGDATIKGNVVNNISLVSSSTSTSVPGVFLGIEASGFGTNTIGGSADSANVIGSTTAGSIAINCTGSGGIAWGIQVSGSSTGTISYNRIGGISISGTGATSFYAIENTATASLQTIRYNQIGKMGSVTAPISNASASTTGACANVGIRLGGNNSNYNNISNNAITNFTYSGTSTSTTTATGACLVGILIPNLIDFAGLFDADTVTNLTSASANTNGPTGSGTPAVGGIFSVSGTTTVQYFSNNIVSDLNQSNAAAVNVTMQGIRVGSNANVSNNLIHSFTMASTSNSTSANMIGINLAAGSAVAQNNMVRLGITSASASQTNAPHIHGIYINTSSAKYIYFNTVYIGGSTTNTSNVPSFAIRRLNSNTSDVIKNNIFINDRSATSGSNHFAMMLNNNTAINGNIDYNIYRATGTGGIPLANGTVVTAPTATYTSIQAWRNFILNTCELHSGIAPSGIAIGSILSNPAVTGAALTLADMKLVANSPAAGTGIGITGISTDIEGNTRSTSSTADMGADESGVADANAANDIFSPVISFTALTNGSTISTRALTAFATVTDQGVGVNTGVGFRPRLYFKRPATADANSMPVANNSSADGWKYVEASNTSSPFNFTIDYSLLDAPAIANGDSIYYFVAAEDVATTPNLGANTYTNIAYSGTPAFATITAGPAASPVSRYTPNRYKINTTVIGDITVCTGGGCTYTSLTNAGGAFEAINNSVIAGNINVTISSDLILEAGTVALNPVAQEGIGNYTVTIKPNTNTLRLINTTGIVAELIKLNGADRVIIDGSFGGTGRFLEFRNSSSGGVALAFENDAQFNTIQNCIFSSQTSTTSEGTIQFKGSASVGSPEGNNDNVVSSCLIMDYSGAPLFPTNAIQSVGNSISAKNSRNTIKDCLIKNFLTKGILIGDFNDAWTIGGSSDADGNEIFQEASRACTHSIDINVTNTGGSNFTVRNNKIYQTSGSLTASSYTGINVSLSAGGVNTIVSDNKVGGANNTMGGSATAHTGTSTFTGIKVSLPSGGDATMNNNTVQNISSAGTFDGINGAGSSGAALYSINNNLVGHASTANSISLSSASGSFAGITFSSANATGTNAISGNRVANITSTATGFSSMRGIYVNSSTGNINVNGNYIYALGSTQAAATTNLIGYENNSLASPGGNHNFYNNMIALDGGSSTNSLTRMEGIRENGPTSGVIASYRNNTVYLGGTGTNKTRCFSRTFATTNTTIQNNIFYNARGGAGNHYAIGTDATTSWSSSFSNYNLLVTPDNTKVGEYGTGNALSFASWKSSSGGDQYSYYDIPSNLSNLFAATPMNGDLSINSTNLEAWAVNGKGIMNSGISSDIAGTVRSTIFGKPIDIGADEFTPSGAALAPPVLNTAVSVGSNNFTYRNRTLFSITFALTAPTSINYSYYSGEAPPNLSNSIYTYYDISPVGGTVTSYGINLNYTPAEISIQTEGGLRIMKSSDAGATWNTTTAATTPVNTSTKTASSVGLIGFSLFTLTGDPVLPLRLLSLQAQKRQHSIEVLWKSVAEMNSSHFEVERSINGVDFYTAGKVLAQGRDITSINRYTFSDMSAIETGVNIIYYRLKMVDIDGFYDYSGIVKVNFKNADWEASVFPNPAASNLFLNLSTPSSETLNWRLSDALGRVCLNGQIESIAGSQMVEISQNGFAALPKGIYFFTLKSSMDTKTMRVLHR